MGFAIAGFFLGRILLAAHGEKGGGHPLPKRYPPVSAPGSLYDTKHQDKLCVA